MANNGQLDGGRLLAKLNQTDPFMGSIFQRVIDGVNSLAQNSSVGANGEIDPPSTPDAISVKNSGEMYHVQITHNSPVNRNVSYFTEASNNPQFAQPIVIDHGTSRTSHPFTLPTFPDGAPTASSVPHNWYFRSYAQYPGSKPSPPAVLGGATNPTAMTSGLTYTNTAATALTLLPSTGSGTASPSGQQGGQGYGNFVNRPAQGPKRSV